MVTTDPCVVNKFGTEAEAVEHAKAWSKSRGLCFTVIHGMGDSGLAYFVEKGDGGMIRNNERLIGHYVKGRLLED